MKLFKKIKSWLFPPLWEYGYCNNRKARRNRKTSEVQFILWKAGEQGHKEDYWHPFNSSWWPNFKVPARKLLICADPEMYVMLMCMKSKKQVMANFFPNEDGTFTLEVV